MAENTQELIHKGKKIVIITEDGAPSANRAPAAAAAGSAPPGGAKVTIDGEAVPVQYDPGTKKYIATSHSPYLSHDTLADLAKHVADHVIDKRSP
jgi:hypothetical protein